VGLKIPSDVRDFVKLRLDVEAVVQRIGRETWDLVVIDPEGLWTRAVFPSREEALAAARDLGVPVHEGWTDRMAQRMSRRDHWGVPGGQRRAQ
jgi:hypothetical protein